MTYVIHYAPDNAVLIIRLALEQRGLPYHAQLVDRAAQAQRAPAYLALNPNGLIPVLETPQGPLFETAAILLWLGDTHGGLGPAPQDNPRGDYLKWLFFVANTLHSALRMMFYPDKYIGPDAADQAALRTGLRGWFDLSATPALLALCKQLEALPCTAALQAAEVLGATPFTAPVYPDPPHGSAT